MNLGMTIVVVVAVLGFALNLLRWFHVEPADVGKFFAKRGQVLSWYIYLSVACVLSLFIGFVFVSMTISLVFQVEIIVMDIIMLWALLGVWMPAIQRLRNKKINNAVDVVFICLAVFILIGFWITQWPAWQTPTILNSSAVIILVAYLINEFVLKRKHHAPDGN